MEDDLAHLKKSVKTNQKTSKVMGGSKFQEKDKANKTHLPSKNKFYTNSAKD